MQVNFNGVKTIVTIPQQSATFSSVTVQRLIDLPTQKKVVAYLQGINEPVILWQGSEYDAIGQWTDSNVSDKIISLYGGTASN